MKNADKNKGPWFHRILIRLFTVAIALLIYWAIGFMLTDIGSWQGPSYDQIQSEMVDPALTETAERLTKDIVITKRSLTDLNADQRIVTDSMNNSRQTMNEMRETYRLALEQAVSPTPAQQDALAASERLFLDNQQRYQQNTEQIALVTSQLRDLDEQQRKNKADLLEARKPVTVQYNTQLDAHKWKIASVKIGVLIPMLAIAVWLFIKHRGKLYAPLIHAFSIALVIHVVFVMHEYFPSEYFKYILTGISLLIASCILVHLLRMVAFPKTDWLIKQYREAYESFLCPVCSYPIRRGPLRFRVWTRRSIRKPGFGATSSCCGPNKENAVASQDGSDGAYTCPVCTTHLYHLCEKCGASRPSLLPACENCGDIVVVQAPQTEDSDAT